MPSFRIPPPPTRPFVGILSLVVTIGLGAHLHARHDTPREPMARAAWTDTLAGSVGTPDATPIAGSAPSSASRSGQPAPAAAKPKAKAKTTTKTEPSAASAPAPAPKPPVPGALPTGKGMWLWLPDRVEGGNSQQIVDRAVASGLSHLYVRMGSSWTGANGIPFINDILPKAHTSGLKVYGWDFPNLVDVSADIARSVAEATYVTPDGHRVDGFVPDIETRSEGTALNDANVVWYLNSLREGVGQGFPIIGCVPRPSAHLTQGGFPYALVAQRVDAIAPMVYWLNRQPDSDVGQAMDYLVQFGKPIIPVGQAYDGSPEGGRPGPPSAEEINRFMSVADGKGAIGASFWSWQHASAEIWSAITTAPQFTVAAAPPAVGPDVIEQVQHALQSRGMHLLTTARWDPSTREAVRVFQGQASLPKTGELTAETVQALGIDLIG
jgi:hypothetical protein